jgi:hypothetical protein
MGSKAKAAQAEEDELLAQISGSMARLGQVGTTMGHELSAQDRKLDALTASVDEVHGKLQSNTKEARRLAK